MQAGLQRLLVPDGQSLCLLQLQGPSLTLYSGEWCPLKCVGTASDNICGTPEN